MESTEVLLYKAGKTIVARFVQDGEPIDDEEGMSLYQPVSLEFPNGEFSAEALHLEARISGVEVMQPSRPSLLDGASAAVMLATLGGLGFDYEMPQEWEDELNARSSGDDRIVY